MDAIARRSGRAGVALLVLLVLVGVVAAGIAVLARSGFVPTLRGEECTVEVGETSATLDLEQAEHASLIAAIAVRRGLPARAVTIAIATAFQESKLHNIDYGDRDSLGLFQQRPSQGWGTPEQIMRPRYAINRFYDGLEKVDGYRSMSVTEAAQAVQRSGFPEAYADHEAYGRALASALPGNSPAAFSCEIRPAEAETAAPGTNGLTPAADAVRVDLREAFGRLPTGGYAPEGVSTGHSEGSKHYEGKAVDVFFRPVTPENTKDGWAVAQYLVANADRLGIATVIFDAKIWTARRSQQGWRDYTVPDRSGDRAILEHRDHVHVDVA
ncbi:hypothetical protein FE697_010865 [Mumia zhuanghuii]|uniref:ARB-07466-like C-terminal domain-containing protein n=2 Tax=Mumia TaxID=1546255 RepID=A0ABW1QHJ8_9ACTN|nr:MULTISPECIES: hypothetical protein [Mumia]KAA1422676.1 hypothetical protein FE697_010865 [Mumia zhuanghuii]